MHLRPSYLRSELQDSLSYMTRPCLKDRDYRRGKEVRAE